MKPKLIISLSTLALVANASADVTVNITGATAFRTATLTAIKAKYTAASSPSFKFAHDAAANGVTGSTRSIFIGVFPGVTGTTTIRCCFTGSVEGIRALTTAVDPLPPTYMPSSVLDSTTATSGGAELAAQGSSSSAVAGSTTATSHIAFSDVAKSSTPYSSYSMLPADPACGVVVFTMLTNEGSTITNVTSQQFRALLTSGFQPLSLFTGNSADETPVFATGRNDGSGTRTAYLAESGFGITNLVKQYVTNVSTSSTLTEIQLVPAGGVNDTNPTTLGTQPGPGQSAANASTVWGQDVAGNGGYNSGSTLRTDMGKTGLSVTVLDENGENAFGPDAKVRADLVTWLSVGDASTARGNGAVFCAFNGVKLDGIAASGSVLTNADKAKIANGSYTAWSYQNMYRRNDITSGDALTVYTAIKAAIPANIGSAGMRLDELSVGREVDGGTVAP